VMEYVEGISLDRLVAKKGTVPVEQAVHFIRQAALGLQHAHEQGMVHRDVKPHNLMVTRKGQVKVLDFGLVRVAEETARPSDGRPLTVLGTVLGTPDYIAPEQVGDSRHVDIRADIYSLGCTLYFLLVGQPPFPEGSAIEKALSHVDQPPVPVRSLRPDVPAELLVVLDRMMAKKPAERFQTPGEVAQALAAIQKPTSQVVEAVEVLPDPPPPPKKKTPRVSDTVEVLPDPPPVPKKKRRKAGRGGFPLWVGGVLGAVALAAVAVGLIAFGFGKRPTQGEPNASGNVAPVLPPAKARKPRVLVVLPHQGFWHPDYEGLRAGLEGKAELVVASSALTPAKPHPEGGGEAVRPTLTLFQAEAADFDAVVFSGGRGRLEYAFDRPFKQQAGEFMERMLASGKVVGGLCMGVAVLASAGVLDGKRATGYPDISDKLTKLGVKYQNQAVEVDGNLITGRDPEAARPFAGRLLKEIDQRAK
jgi:putative intracellular protease/amidase